MPNDPAGTPAAIAFALLSLSMEAEPELKTSRARLLDTFAECLAAVNGERVLLRDLTIN